jgi:hypothetical protein
MKESTRISFTSSDDVKLLNYLKETHSKLSESKSKLTIPFEADLTSDSVKEIYKHYPY